jgi:type II secretory pathway component PulF
MPLYQATYATAAGREIKQRLQSASADALRVHLRAGGFYPLTITEVASTHRERRLSFPPKTLARVLRQLEMQIRAGVDEIGAVASLKDTHSNPKVRFMLSSVHATLSTSRTTFSDALGSFPRVIPPHLRAVISAGEGMGPEHTAHRLADVRDWILFTLRLRETAIRASRYPLFLLGLTFGYVAFFVTWFIPRFTTLLDAFNMSLPAYTLGIISTSRWVQHYWPVLAAGAVAVVAAWHLVRRVERLALVLDRVLIRAPLYRKIYQALTTAIVAKNIRSLVSSGATAIEALSLCEAIVSNLATRAEIRRLVRDMRDGANFGTALRRSGYFPPEAVSIIATGEESGFFDKALDDVSTEYATSAREAVEDALSFLQPALVVLCAVLVGAVLFGLFLPLAQLYDTIQ